MCILMSLFLLFQVIFIVWLCFLQYRVSELEISENSVFIGGTRYKTRDVLIAIMRNLKIRVSYSKSSVMANREEKIKCKT